MIPVLDRADHDRIAADLRRLLPGWLGAQRWFAGKGHGRPAVTPLLVELVCPGDPALFLALVDTGHDEAYQLLVGVRATLPEALAGAVIGHGEGPDGQPVTLYEAAADPELTARLLDRFDDDRPGPGAVRFHRAPGAVLPTGLAGRLLTAEQSNTSLVFGDRAVLKVLRRPVSGTSPELEVLAALDAAPGVLGAAPLGWIATDPAHPAGPATLAVLQEYLPNQGDGWELAVAEAARYIDGTDGRPDAAGTFTAESFALGQATAKVHCALSQRLGSRTLDADGAAALAGELTRRLDDAVAELPALAVYAAELRTAYAALAGAHRTGPLHLQRVHGDLHLGQVLSTPRGWALIDFEGEPGHALAERRRPRPPLRDVAAMLRSYDYAARHALTGPAGTPHPADARAAHRARRAREWADRNRSAFGAGYAYAGGPAPRAHPHLMRAFEADKAVYEAVYEARNRPAWLSIPLAALDRLTRPGPPAGRPPRS
ncbi:maltokinase [Streptomyces sp. NPDC089919]|uniref:maltokinase N-terminal cap-like domain-containing protein n=1 Tax=Streptomyces sp. NPDC089919 TaxID=3155188 RepID=UPI00342278BF